MAGEIEPPRAASQHDAVARDTTTMMTWKLPTSPAIAHVPHAA
jgi:hypothetical protein